MKKFLMAILITLCMSISAFAYPSGSKIMTFPVRKTTLTIDYRFHHINNYMNEMSVRAGRVINFRDVNIDGILEILNEFVGDILDIEITSDVDILWYTIVLLPKK